MGKRNRKNQTSGMESRIAGAIFGVAAGDAIGSSIEFKSKSEVLKLFPKGVREVVGGGSFDWRPGEGTDDTDLTAAVLRAYINRGSKPLLKTVADNFVEWFDAGPKDFGGTTASGIIKYKKTGDPKKSGLASEDSAANGSLMRCIATGIVRTDGRTRRRESVEISSITHAERRATESCLIYNDLVDCLISGMPSIDAVAWVINNSPVSPDVKAVVASAGNTPIAHLDPSGYVLGSLGIGVWALAQDGSMEDIMAKAFSLGGDADTYGAIMGGLLGASMGISAMPSRWIKKLEYANEFATMVPKLTSLRLGKTSGLGRWNLEGAGRKDNKTKNFAPTMSTVVNKGQKGGVFHTVSSKLPKNVVTLDMDGTAFDSWACCKKRDGGWGGSETCAHLREDTIKQVREMAAKYDAAIVVLSWRAGGEDTTRKWLKRVNLENEIAAVFVPGGSEDIASHTSDVTSGFGQVGYKVKVVESLKAMGHTVVASFDDRDSVIEALGKAGVINPIHVKHAVSVADHEWSAGYLGAPKVSPSTHKSSYNYSSQKSLFDDPDTMFPIDYDDDGFAPEYGDDLLMSRETFDEMMELGEGEYGRDYVFSADGEVISLHTFIDDDDDEFDKQWGEEGEFRLTMSSSLNSSEKIEQEMDAVVDEMASLSAMKDAFTTDLQEGNWSVSERVGLETDILEIDDEISSLNQVLKQYQKNLLEKEIKAAPRPPKTETINPRDNEGEWRAQKASDKMLNEVMENRVQKLAKQREERALRQKRKESPKNTGRRTKTKKRRIR